MGLFLIDDMIEKLGKNILEKIWWNLSEPLFKFANNSACLLRQSSFYGIGLLAKNSGDSFKNSFEKSLKLVFQGI